MQQIKITPQAHKCENNSLVIYFKEIRKIKVLTSEEECSLIRKHREGDPYALEKVVKANLRFVVSVAKHYRYQGMDLSDLISEGNIGLIKAVDKFDETKGFRFISYAIWWIRQSILKALQQNSRIIRISRHKLDSLNKTIQLFKQLEQEFEREPAPEELSDILGIKSGAVREILGCAAKHISINAPVSVYDAPSLLDTLEDTDACRPDNGTELSESLDTAIHHLFGVLNENQAEVVKLYYGLEEEERMTHAQISKKLNVSSERIRQIKEAALKRLKESDGGRNLVEQMRV